MLGCDAVYLFVDDSAELADIAIAKEHEALGVSVTFCDEDYWKKHMSKSKTEIHIYSRQIFNANAACRAIHEKGISWLVHIDDDEYVDASKDCGRFGYELAILPSSISILLLPVSELCNIGDVLPESHEDLLSLESLHWKTRIVEKPERIQSLMDRLFLGIERRLLAFIGFLHGKRTSRFRLYNGHLEGKCAVRSSCPAGALQLHTPLHVSRGNLRISKIGMLHLMRTNYLEWKRKAEWRIAGNLSEPTYANEDREFQLRSRISVNALEDLYKENYVIDRRLLASLKRTGFVKVSSNKWNQVFHSRKKAKEE
jgi:hypothetical protein